jgi:hypothetical protein
LCLIERQDLVGVSIKREVYETQLVHPFG